MGIKNYVKYQKQMLQNRYNNRIGQGFVSKDLGVYYRLQKAGRITQGTGSYGVPSLFTHIYDDTKVTIGNWSSVGSRIALGGGHPVDRITTYPLSILLGLEGAGKDGFPAPSKDTVIGSDVYGGLNSLIMSGVTIGDGAVLGVNSLITKDVPAYAIVGGSPGKIIRYRFNEEQIAALQEICWWDWPLEEIKEAAPMLASPDIDGFIEWARSRPHGKGPRIAGAVRVAVPAKADAPALKSVASSG